MTAIKLYFLIGGLAILAIHTKNWATELIKHNREKRKGYYPKKP